MAAPRSWRLALGISAGAILGAALLAGTVGLTAWALRPVPQPAVSGSSTPAQMLPLPPPSTTVTIQATPPPVASPAPAPAEIPSKDEQFVKQLATHAITVEDRAQAIYTAHWICTQRANGRTVDDIVNLQVPVKPKLTYQNLTDFTTTAIDIYCPQYRR
jgi:hypothetical protein